MTWAWLLASAAAWVGARLLARTILGWSRERRLGVTNYRGRWVPLGLGIAWALATGSATAAVAALALAASFSTPGGSPGTVAAEAGALAALTAWILWAALVGWIDDLFGDGSSRGLRGHGTALAEGRLTTGALKLILLAGGSLAVAFSLPDGTPTGFLWPLAGAGLIALTVNGANLLDLRPGRALKGSLLLLGLALVAAPREAMPALPGATAALALLGWDLREGGVLGDAGANALGALAGWALWRALSPAALVAVLVGLAALHVYAEKASISDGIEGFRFLRWLDRLGRLEPGPKGEGGGASN